MPVDWVDGVTPVNAANLETIEADAAAAKATADAAQPKSEKGQSSGYAPLDASSFLPETHLEWRLRGVVNVVADVDLAEQSGWYWAANGTPHLPAATDFYLFVIAYSPDYVLQHAYEMYGSRSWKRFQSGGGWTPWVQTWPLDAALPARLSAASQAPPGNDLNNAFENGWYRGYDGVLHPPLAASYWLVEAVNLDGDSSGAAKHVRQIAYKLDDDQVWMRRCVGGAWQPWVQTWPLTGIYQAKSEKGMGDGYAPLNEGGRLPDHHFPERLMEVAVPIYDWDNANLNGWFTSTGVVPNSPAALSGQAITGMVVRTGGPLTLTQTVWASNLVNSAYAPRYERRLAGGSWGPWLTIAAGAGVDYIGDWAAGTAYKKGDVVRRNGVDYLAVNDSTGQTPPALGVIPPIGLGTVLPAAPVDGQEFVLVDSLTAPTYSWRFRYVASITDAYKWVFIGGAAQRAEVLTNETTASAVPTDLATVVGLTLLRAGIYAFQHGATLYSPTSDVYIYAGLKIGAAGTSNNETAFIRIPGAGAFVSVTRGLTKTCAAADVIKQQYWLSVVSGTLQAEKRWIHAIPVRVA